MQVEPRIDLAKATLAVFALAAVANRFWLHWCSITPADLIAGVLVAATVAVAGLRPGANARLFAMWMLWGVLCLGELFLLRRVDHIGVEVIMALGFSASSRARATLGAVPRPLPASTGRAVFRTNGRIERRRPPLVTATALPASRALAAPLTAKEIHHVRSSSVRSLRPPDP